MNAAIAASVGIVFSKIISVLLIFYVFVKLRMKSLALLQLTNKQTSDTTTYHPSLQRQIFMSELYSMQQLSSLNQDEAADAIVQMMLVEATEAPLLDTSSEHCESCRDVCSVWEGYDDIQHQFCLQTECTDCAGTYDPALNGLKEGLCQLCRGFCKSILPGDAEGAQNCMNDDCPECLG